MRLQQEQKQILTQAMVQSLDILQLPLLSLQGYLEELLLGNPLAELECGNFGDVSLEYTDEREFDWEESEQDESAAFFKITPKRAIQELRLNLSTYHKRTSQSLCKAPVWCRIEAPHRRNYK